MHLICAYCEVWESIISKLIGNHRGHFSAILQQVNPSIGNYRTLGIFDSAVNTRWQSGKSGQGK